MRFLFLFFAFLYVNPVFSATDNWPTYGKDSGGGHYSKATEITPENVKDLKKVWVHRSGDYHEGGNWREGLGSNLQTSLGVTPILVDETLYYCTPYNRVFALDAETGKEKWVFDPNVELEGKALLHCRGVSSWKDKTKIGNEKCSHRIIAITIDAEIFAIDGKTGELCQDFGANGRIDLREGLGDHDPSHYWSTSPPAIINDKLVIGGGVMDNLTADIPGGVVRAYDIRTGELVWSWDPIPLDQSPVFDDNGNQLYQRGTANVWSVISADHELNMVYLPTGNATPDYFGGHREGLEDYSSSVVALNADTGEVVWYFQTIHHDIWDYDVPSQPTFFDFERNGQIIKALAQTTKTGLVFLLNRENGEPIFPIEEREVPQGAVEGDYVSKTQPFPTKPLPLSDSYFDPEESSWGFTFLDKGYCKKIAKELRSEGLYTPPSLQGSIHYPSGIGGNNWGGPAIDHSRNIMVVNTMNLASIIKMIPRKDCDKPIEELAGNILTRHTSIEANTGTPYCNLRSMGFFSNFNVPCTKPPWGKLTAIDLSTGDQIWDIPLGTSKDLAPFPFHWIKGAPNMGGPTVTASGVTFIAATSDYYLRAFNTETGEEITKFRLPTGGHATPMTYTNKSGKQFVVIAAGGHWTLSPASDHIIAYALP
jgi:quinoprotein glucose dehydrogenase